LRPRLWWGKQPRSICIKGLEIASSSIGTPRNDAKGVFQRTLTGTERKTNSKKCSQNIAEDIFVETERIIDEKDGFD
jgi:hypothetical protein